MTVWLQYSFREIRFYQILVLNRGVLKSLTFEKSSWHLSVCPVLADKAPGRRDSENFAGDEILSCEGISPKILSTKPGALRSVRKRIRASFLRKENLGRTVALARGAAQNLITWTPSVAVR